MNEPHRAVSYLLSMLSAALCVPSPLLAAQQPARLQAVSSEQWIAAPHTAPTCIRFALIHMAAASATPEPPSCRRATLWTAAAAPTSQQDPPERHSKWVTGLALGFVGGALLGAGIGYAADVEGNDTPPELLAAVGAGIGALGGAVIGAIIGASIHVERSRDPPGSALRFTAFPHPQASLRVAFSF